MTTFKIPRVEATEISSNEYNEIVIRQVDSQGEDGDAIVRIPRGHLDTFIAYMRQAAEELDAANEANGDDEDDKADGMAGR